MTNDAAARWGLPPGFAPVRYRISDDVKDILRDLLSAQEPVVVSLGNQSETLWLIATPQRMFSARTGATAGVTGCTIREYPWEGITDLTLQPGSLNAKITVGYRTTDGRTVEVGQRAKLARATLDNLMPFDPEAAAAAYQAIYALWQQRRAGQ